MTDQDVDGSHIKGLLFNLFNSMWPSLIQIDGFMNSMLTPIIKAKNKKVIHEFYNLTDYENWKKKMMVKNGILSIIKDLVLLLKKKQKNTLKI